MIPRELTGSIPRNVTLSGNGIVLAVFALVMAIGAVVAAIALSLAHQRSADDARLRAREGVAAQGHVLGVRRQGGKQPARFITYRYDVDGRDYVKEIRLSDRDRRPVATGDTIAIGYVRSRPAMTWIEGAEPSIDPPLWLIPFASLAALGGAAAALWAIRRQWLLLAEGRPAEARVLSSKRIPGQHGSRYRVSYQFETLGGGTVTGRAETRRAPPPVGSPLTIVYHRDSPQWSGIYPLQFVRPQR